jgi:hypothetical protein
MNHRVNNRLRDGLAAGFGCVPVYQGAKLTGGC